MALKMSNNSKTRFGKQMDAVDKAIDKILAKNKSKRKVTGGGSAAGLGNRRNFKTKKK